MFKKVFTDVKEFKEEQKPTDLVSFKIVYNKQTYSVTLPLDDTVESLKLHIEKLTEVPIQMQKLMFKGRMKEEGTLRDNKLTTGSKIMVVGSTMNDVIAVSQASSSVVKESNSVAGTSNKEPLSKQKPHKTVLEKYGMPDDVMPGIKNCQEPLPRIPLSGMYNKSGGRVRLTFKLEADQVWIGTKERTEKLSLGSIKAVVSEPIDGHEQYHLMALQLGPTEASRYWIYWVPSQYINAIKDAILGNWQFF
ncbi:hypothetical protein HELRODRAFT_62886 [Helobdella robusta]|uniref:Ubiquitin-like domain-containing protein n=1 Tax=Helobdella robusta TaxID=6412 RepID=T1FX67_HELRO|nr:hypothetical protein HELRODRAFT_62886 [Helobdella robusta]ESO12437.1 hypothetical protein HELRODRAFT_62886 [Helobdella robusta]